VDSGADGAGDVEKDDHHDHGDREDDPKHERPAWCAARRPAVPGRAGALGALRVNHVGFLLSQAGLRKSGSGYRDRVSVSNQAISPLVVTYTSLVPKLWADTIETHRREVRDAILDTTAALVMEHGLLTVTMSQIAEETGIGRATLYKYFPDVEAILLAWHERKISGHLEHLGEVGNQDGDAGQRLAAVLQAYALISHDSRGHHDSELAAFLHRGDQVVRAERELRDLVRGLVAEAVRSGELRDDVAPDELANFCLHALAAASSLPSKAAVRRLVAVTLAGLRRGD
jgi:AcrR family transcriptional regulator